MEDWKEAGLWKGKERTRNRGEAEEKIKIRRGRLWLRKGERVKGTEIKEEGKEKE